MAVRPDRHHRRRRTRFSRVVAAATVASLALAFGLVQSGWTFRLLHPLAYAGYIRTHAHNYDLPPELLAAVIYQESRFDPKARSSAGAVGLMQLTPSTASGIAQLTGGGRFHLSDLTDPEINIRYGAFYLRRMHRRFRESGEDYTASLAAYNAGQGAVSKWLAADADHRLTVDEIPYRETREYVQSVRQLRDGYRTAYADELGIRR